MDQLTVEHGKGEFSEEDVRGDGGGGNAPGDGLIGQAVSDD